MIRPLLMTGTLQRGHNQKCLFNALYIADPFTSATKSVTEMSFLYDLLKRQKSIKTNEKGTKIIFFPFHIKSSIQIFLADTQRERNRMVKTSNS